MDFLELVKERYSVRKFLDKKVEKEKLDKILEAGRLAPTAANLQPQRILVIEKKEELEKVKKCTRFDFDAPLILLVCYDKNESWKRKYDGKSEGETDASIVTTHMMLEAAFLGLGSTWVASLDPFATREVFHIPDNLEIQCFLPIGYPASDAEPNPKHFERKTIGETVTYTRLDDLSQE